MTHDLTAVWYISESSSIMVLSPSLPGSNTSTTVLYIHRQRSAVVTGDVGKRASVFYLYTSPPLVASIYLRRTFSSCLLCVRRVVGRPKRLDSNYAAPCSYTRIILV